MKNWGKFSLCWFSLFLLCALFVSCSDNSVPESAPGGTIPIQNAVVESTPFVPNPQNREIHMMKSRQEFEEATKLYSISSEISAVYEEAFFEQHDLILISFGTGPGLSYSVQRLVRQGGSLTVYLQEKSPRAVDLPRTGVEIFVETERGKLDNVNNKRVDVETVYTD